MENLGLIAVIVPEDNATTLNREDWELLQDLIKEGNPNAMLATARAYYYSEVGEQDLDKAEEFAQQALENGCDNAEAFLKEVKEFRENFDD